MHDWERRAAALAAASTHPTSRWAAPISAVPRHLFVPRWWERSDGEWEVRDGAADPDHWLETAYSQTSMVTSIAGQHADRAEPGDRRSGRPTSSATLPRLVVRMFQHAYISPGDQLLDVGTGSGYGAALAALRLGAERVTSVDVDPYLVEAARERLAQAGLHPTVEVVDATGELPGEYDRIVATVAMPHVPASWLAALRTGGRLVTTIAGTSLIVTATKHEDGAARGVVEYDRAGFMHARRAAGDYPAGASELLDAAREREDGGATLGAYPLLDVEQAWDLDSALGLTVPGVVHDFVEDDDGHCSLVMAHPDGSWARAEAVELGKPVVLQGGPRQLFDVLEDIRTYQLETGELPVRGAQVLIEPDGTTKFVRGDWRATLAPDGKV